MKEGKYRLAPPPYIKGYHRWGATGCTKQAKADRRYARNPARNACWGRTKQAKADRRYARHPVRDACWGPKDGTGNCRSVGAPGLEGLP